MTNRNQFQIEATWPDGIAPGEPDVANIEITVGSANYTFLADQNGTSRRYVRASAVSFALWIVDNWWRLRFEPFPDNLVPPTEWRLRHELTSIQGGTLWPPIMIYGEGQRVLIGPRAGAWDIPGPVRYLSVPLLALDGETFEQSVDTFLKTVVDKCAHAADVGALSDLLKVLQRERADAGVAVWRRLEAQLGYDIDQVPDELMKAMTKYEKRYGEAAVGEAAVAAPGAGSAGAVAEAIKAAQSSAIQVDTEIARDLVSAGTRPSSITPPWKIAEKAASELRQQIGKKGRLRYSDFADLLQANAKRLKDAPATARYLQYGALLSATARWDSCAFRSLPRSRARRFEIGRILGDAAWLGSANKGENLFAPISHAKSDRQKFQRAFSQSFLCPFDDVMALIDTETPSENDIAKASDHFDVSPRVITTLLVNKGVLERERLEDQIEAA